MLPNTSEIEAVFSPFYNESNKSSLRKPGEHNVDSLFDNSKELQIN
jgi:hypothetical protein